MAPVLVLAVCGLGEVPTEPSSIRRAWLPFSWRMPHCSVMINSVILSFSFDEVVVFWAAASHARYWVAVVPGPVLEKQGKPSRHIGTQASAGVVLSAFL